MEPHGKISPHRVYMAALMLVALEKLGLIGGHHVGDEHHANGLVLTFLHGGSSTSTSITFLQKFPFINEKI